MIRTIIKILALGTGPGESVATCAHLENEDGICYEDLTATYSTSGAARLVR